MTRFETPAKRVRPASLIPRLQMVVGRTRMRGEPPSFLQGGLPLDLYPSGREGIGAGQVIDDGRCSRRGLVLRFRKRAVFVIARPPVTMSLPSRLKPTTTTSGWLSLLAMANRQGVAAFSSSPRMIPAVNPKGGMS
jgi:hypothetical protein